MDEDSKLLHTATKSLSMESGLFSSLVPHGLLVKLVFTKARPNTLQVGDVVTQLLDSFHLLMQIVTLNEVSHLE